MVFNGKNGEILSLVSSLIFKEKPNKWCEDHQSTKEKKQKRIVPADPPGYRKNLDAVRDRLVCRLSDSKI